MLRVFAIVLALCIAGPAAAEEPPSLEAGLAREAKAILDHARKENQQTIGVLKFLLIREGDKKFTDSLGTLNSLLARRLEIALIVKNSPKEPIGILENPSAVAEKIPGASHLNKDGLEKLFAAEYPLAWGKTKAKPDAFIAGTGLVSEDLRTLTLSLHVIDGKTRKLRVLTDKAVVKLRPEHLTEIGESFHRGIFDQGTVTAKEQEGAAVDAARKVRKDADTPHPLQDPKAPFTLEVWYAGKKQEIEFRDGQAWIPEPAENQKVELRYVRRNRSAASYGLVIKVNGENTLFRQKLPDTQCRCWISDPKQVGQTETVDGFQVTDAEKIPFRVASREESKAREVHYGTDVGTITMTVFRGTLGKPKKELLNYDQKDELAIGRSELPAEVKKDANTFQDLQQSLYSSLDRGLIVEGNVRVGEEIERFDFKKESVPVMAVTIHYYRK